MSGNCPRVIRAKKYNEHKTPSSIISTQQNLPQFPEIRRPETRDGVPPHCRLIHVFRATHPYKSENKARTLNPGVPHPGAFPTVMSLNPSPFSAYIRGLRKPSAGWPAESRASFSRATKAANEGVDAEVPPICTALPRKNIRKKAACADTSGMACLIMIRLSIDQVYR